jgi:hypothetical protein
MAASGLLLVYGLAHADLLSDAHRVLERRLAMAVPVTVFEKWQADQWTFAAGECLVRAPTPNKNDIAKLNSLPIYGGGSFSAAKDLGKTCATLAEFGPAPVCFAMYSRQAPFAMPWQGMHADYLFLADANLPKAGTEHVVGGYCQLVKNRPETQQFFAGKATLQWLLQPRFTAMQTAAGSRTVRAGTIAFEVQGLPNTPEPTMVLAP